MKRIKPLLQTCQVRYYTDKVAPPSSRLGSFFFPAMEVDERRCKGHGRWNSRSKQGDGKQPFYRETREGGKRVSGVLLVAAVQFYIRPINIVSREGVEKQEITPVTWLLARAPRPGPGPINATLKYRNLDI